MNNNNNKGYFIHNSNAKPLNECIKVVHSSRLLALFDLTKNSVSLYTVRRPTTHLLKSRTINSAGTKWSPREKILSLHTGPGISKNLFFYEKLLLRNSQFLEPDCKKYTTNCESAKIGSDPNYYIAKFLLCEF